MEQNSFQEETNVETPKDHLAPLKCVTPLSKYLALALFIILPFLGGWIGYTYAPERVVEVERFVQSNEATKATHLESMAEMTELTNRQWTTISLTNDTYRIPLEKYLDTTFDLSTYDEAKSRINVTETTIGDHVSLKGRKLNEQYSLLESCISCTHAPSGLLVFDENEKQVVRSYEYGDEGFFFEEPTMWVHLNEKNGPTQSALIILNDNSVVLYDYINNSSEVIYNEFDESITLLEICGMTCIGLLEKNLAGELIVGRYTKGKQGDLNNLLEIVKISMPAGYSINPY